MRLLAARRVSPPPYDLRGLPEPTRYGWTSRRRKIGKDLHAYNPGVNAEMIVGVKARMISVGGVAVAIIFR